MLLFGPSMFKWSINFPIVEFVFQDKKKIEL